MMGIVAWVKNLWDNEEVTFCCPKCGCKNIEYFSVIANFVQVVRDTESPKYKELCKCTHCGFTTTNKKELKKEINK